MRRRRQGGAMADDGRDWMPDDDEIIGIMSEGPAFEWTSPNPAGVEMIWLNWLKARERRHASLAAPATLFRRRRMVIDPFPYLRLTDLDER